MDLEFLLLNSKDDLLAYKQDILDLFQRSYEDSLDPALWQWAYIDNIHGAPIVSLCFSNKKLVGHYAVVPIELSQNQTPIKACLSMTTMVDKDFRGLGLFTKLAEQVYARAEELGYHYVFGFPNSNSTPGFRKYLAWELAEPDFVVRASKQQLLDSKDLQRYLKHSDFIVPNINSSDYLKWRTAKPGQTYQQKGNCITKAYNDSYDIVYLSPNFADELEDGQEYNVLIDASVADLKPLRVFDYQYGYRDFKQSSSKPKFKKDLILSDVF